MAFTNSWVETDPDGSVITVSQLDNSDRLIKNAVRERLEGDPAAPDLTGLIEVGSFAAAPKPRKGTARVYVDTQANILAFGATKREDGRLAVASDTGQLYHVATAGVVTVKVAAADVVSGALTVTQLTITTAVSRIIPGATSFAIRNNANTNDNLLVSDAGNVSTQGTLTAGTDLIIGSAVSRIRPGVTSLSLRNNANAADNLILTDAGLATFRNTVTVSAGGITVTGASTITGTLGGVTTFSVTTVTATGVVTASQLTISTAIGKIVPGVTSLSLRNNADTQDNLIITDGGVATIRGGLVVTVGGVNIGNGGIIATGASQYTNGFRGGVTLLLDGPAVNLTPNGYVDTNYYRIRVTTGGAFTINNPVNNASGQTISFEIENASGGAMGAITWGANYLLAGAFTNPLNTKRRTISFFSFSAGGPFTEVCRAAADI